MNSQFYVCDDRTFSIMIILDILQMNSIVVLFCLLCYQVKLTCFSGRRLITSVFGTIKQLSKILPAYD